MLIGLISDTHIPDRAVKIPEKVVDTFKNVDLIIHAGDLTNIEVIKELENIAEVIAVQGNTDKYIELGLEKSKVIEIEGLKIGVNHGEVYPRGNTQQLYYIAKELNVDILISGHTHQPMVEKVKDVLLLNPGSPTVPRLADQTVMILKIENKEVDVKLIKIGGPICSCLQDDIIKW